MFISEVQVFFLLLYRRFPVFPPGYTRMLGISGVLHVYDLTSKGEGGRDWIGETFILHYPCVSVNFKHYAGARLVRFV